MEDMTCLDCKRPTVMVFDHSSGDTICSECGLVLEDHFIQDSEEWRTFSSDENRSDRDPNRVGAPTNHLLKSGGLATVVEKPKENASSVVVSKADLSILCRPQSSLKNTEEDLIKKAFKEIERMSEALQLNIVVRSRACEIISKLNANKNLCRGKKLYAQCAASVSTACRDLNLSRTLKEISMAANCVEPKKIRRESNKIKDLLEKDQASESTRHAIINTRELVRRFCSKLDMSQREIMAIREAVQKAENFDIRRNPKSVLAAIIFMISHISQANNRPIREIGIVAEVVENTIKNSVKDMYPNYAVKIIPSWYACEADIIKRLGGIISSWDSAKHSV